MRLLAAVVLAAALAGAAQAASPSYVTLPSPVAALSSVPPLGGGAAAASENVRHRITAHTDVRVSIGRTGAPFAVVATQRLDVRVKGDFFFTIGAPVLDVTAAPGSGSTPGLRSASILWAGFDPGRRTLAARATLDPAVAGAALPLRVEVRPSSVTLVNATATIVGAYNADALRPGLLRYWSTLRRDVSRGVPPQSGSASVTTRPESARLRVSAPLLVSGTIGGRHVSGVVTDRLTIHGSGPIDLRVVPTAPRQLLATDVSGLSGRALLAHVIETVLTIARARQYDRFLGNPDPTGSSATIYRYKTSRRSATPAAIVTPAHGRDWGRTAAIAGGLVLLAGAGLAVWSRS